MALALLTMHERAAHPATGGGGDSTKVKKPEKFPRPQIDQDSTAEAWDEFHTAWLQYKDEQAVVCLLFTKPCY